MAGALEEKLGARLREGVEAARGPDGTLAFRDLPLERLWRAPAHGLSEGWLAARYLTDEERSRGVVAWEYARIPRRLAGSPPAIAVAPGARFSCHESGACCSCFTPGPITEAERQKVLSRDDFFDELFRGEPKESFFEPHQEECDPESPGGERLYDLARRGGKCRFLGKNGRCLVHERLGTEYKFLVCREFPLAIRPCADGIFVALRPECESMHLSRSDGRPLEEQREWIEAVLAGRSRCLGPRIYRLAGETFVPYALTRVLEQRVAHFLSFAEDPHLAFLAGRDAVLALVRRAPAIPDCRDLDRLEDFLVTSPLERLREVRGRLDSGRAIRALGLALEAIQRTWTRAAAHRAAVLPDATRERESDALYGAIVGGLYARLAAAFGWPQQEDAPPDAAWAASLADRAQPGDDSPEVRDYLRDYWIEAIAAKRPLLAEASVLFGYARIAFGYLLGRFGARLLAGRRGAEAASVRDWNLALAAVERAHTTLKLENAEGLLSDLYADLFFSQGLPA